MKVADQVLNTLRQRGERLTIQRRLVIEALASGDHQTIAQIQHTIEQHGQSLDSATVYRILEHLNAIGVVSHTDMGTRGIVYELIGSKPHHHLVCLSCGAVIEMDDSLLNRLRDALQRDYAFQPRLDHLAIFGYCHICQEKGLDKSTPEV